MEQAKLPIYFIKLGGSLFTNKRVPDSFDKPVLQRLFSELSKFYHPQHHRLILGNGAGGTTHYLAKKYRTMNGFSENDSYKLRGACLVKESAVRHHALINRLGIEAGLPLFSFSASSLMAVDAVGEEQTFFTSLLYCLQNKMIPHFYGDVILNNTLKTTIFSTEKIFKHLVIFLHKNGYRDLRIFFLGDTNGVLNENGQTVPEISPLGFQSLRQTIGKSSGHDVTGGMRQKVELGLGLAGCGAKVYVAGGKQFNAATLLQPQKNRFLTRIVS